MDGSSSPTRSTACGCSSWTALALLDEDSGGHREGDAREHQKDRRNCLQAAAELGVDIPLIQFLRDRNLPGGSGS
jgi:hypothetical protein